MKIKEIALYIFICVIATIILFSAYCYIRLDLQKWEYSDNSFKTVTIDQNKTNYFIDQLNDKFEIVYERTNDDCKIEWLRKYKRYFIFEIEETYVKIYINGSIT